MKIAITGGSGDIGGAYLRYAAQNNEINALLREKASLRDIPANAKIHSFLFTTNTSVETKSLQEFTNTDALIHFAGLLNLPGYSLDEFVAVNALLTGLLTSVSQKNNPKPKLVYISSEMVYKLDNTPQLQALSDAFVVFCKDHFSDQNQSIFDLTALAKQFIAANYSFPWSSYNAYALTKYLGECIILSDDANAVLRITNAYGPGYDNMRLIPKLIVNRLQGHDITYKKEQRDFVYNDDIHQLIDIVLTKAISGTIDCKSGQLTDVKDLVKSIIHLTPTAYGQIEELAESSQEPGLTHPLQKAEQQLTAILGKALPFQDGLLRTMRYHKEKCYHEMNDLKKIEDFILPNEKFVRKLHGSSSAYTFVVEDEHQVKKVRKVAIRDGVEGNGIAKVKKEIEYYKYIAKHHPELAKMYPQLYDSAINGVYSSETIEYLDDKNFYEELKTGQESEETYTQSLSNFVTKLLSITHASFKKSESSEDDLDSYYLERALDRLQPIKDIIQVRDQITINERVYRAPHVILTELLNNASLRSYFTPQLTGFCFHGDLTLLNTVYSKETNEIRLIDPRGVIEEWDPLYDFGKLKMTLGGFGEFILGDQPIVARDGDTFEVNFNQIPDVVRKLNTSFLAMLGTNELFARYIIPHEPHWKERILLAEATHLLADIPFRLYIDNTQWTALASYVVGTYYLNTIYDSLMQA